EDSIRSGAAYSSEIQRRASTCCYYCCRTGDSDPVEIRGGCAIEVEVQGAACPHHQISGNGERAGGVGADDAWCKNAVVGERPSPPDTDAPGDIQGTVVGEAVGGNGKGLRASVTNDAAT